MQVALVTLRIDGAAFNTECFVERPITDVSHNRLPQVLMLAEDQFRREGASSQLPRAISCSNCPAGQ